jgi:hypothetical protein
MIQIFDKFGKLKSSGIPGFGTVTSVSSGNLSPLFTSSVTSSTSTPNITFASINQAQKLFYASPNASTGTPSFRAIQISDLPSLSGTYVPVSRNLTINGVTFDLSADRTWTISIPTNTSDLVNDGENGTSPYVTLAQLPSNLNLFATNASSDIATYFKLVTSIDDPDYNTTPVNIPTGAITTTGQFIAALATTANVLVGNPGIINLLTIGNVRRTSGSGTAEFYYEVYHRDSGGTETLIATSSKTPPVSANVYTEFLAAALLNNGVFLATDRIVVKYYADRIGSGSNPQYEFQFGGASPVRTTFPVPATNIPLDATPTSGSTNGVQSGGVFNALALKQDISANIATGVTISFLTYTVYGTLVTPETGNITADVTDAKLGVTNIIIHNSATEPTFSGEFKKLSGSGNYVVSVVNYIYCTFITSTEIIYSINQRT